MAFWDWPDLVLFAVNGACFLLAFPLYLYFRDCDASGMRLAGNTVILCAASNGLLLAANSL